MATDDRQDNPDTELPEGLNPSPGRLLREAREAAGMSLEALADRLHLHKATLQALEEDRFGDLPEPPYVRGYLRGCAKALEMEPEPLLQAFRASGQPAGPEEEQPPGPVRGRIESPAGLRRFSPGLLRIAIFGAVLALVIAGTWSLVTGGGTDGDAPASAGTTGVQDREEVPAITQEVPGSVAPTDAADPLPEPIPLQASGAGDDGPLAPEGGGTGAAQAPGSEPPESGTDARGDDALGDGVPAITSGREEREGEASPGLVRMRMVFREDCWVQIADADGEALLSGLIRAGREHRLEGVAPIRVFLGNAPGVELTFNGRRVDTAGRARDDRTARFTLGSP